MITKIFSKKLKKMLDFSDQICYNTDTIKKGDKKMYEIFPCDLDLMGECPKRCQNCAECVGYVVHEEEEEE